MNLDAELFEQVNNIPHEVDEWGRRVYNDAGDRILYYRDEDGNTVVGYEAWFPCSVVGDYEDDGEGDAVVSGYCYPNFYLESENGNGYEEEEESIPDYNYRDDERQSSSSGSYCTAPALQSNQHGFAPTTTSTEQQRIFSDFLAARNEEFHLLFESDMERIAKWVVGACGAGDEEVEWDVVSQWSEIR